MLEQPAKRRGFHFCAGGLVEVGHGVLLVLVTRFEAAVGVPFQGTNPALVHIRKRLTLACVLNSNGPFKSLVGGGRAARDSSPGRELLQ